MRPHVRERCSRTPFSSSKPKAYMSRQISPQCLEGEGWWEQFKHERFSERKKMPKRMIRRLGGGAAYRHLHICLKVGGGINGHSFVIPQRSKLYLFCLDRKEDRKRKWGVEHEA